MNEITVRLASDQEMDLVHEIMLLAFEEYRGVLDPPSGAHQESVEDVRRSAAKGGALLALLDGEPVGSARFEVRGEHVFCWRLAVLPSSRGRGLAQAMLRFVHAWAEQAGLPEVRLVSREVLGSNLRYYEKLGYRVVSRQPHPAGEAIIVEFVRQIP